MSEHHRNGNGTPHATGEHPTSICVASAMEAIRGERNGRGAAVLTLQACTGEWIVLTDCIESEELAAMIASAIRRVRLAMEWTK